MVGALVIEALVLGVLVLAGYRIWVWRRDLRISRRLGGYRLRAQIGAGMSEVWLAWHEHMRREVALKLLRVDAAPEIARARFEREVTLIEEVRSPYTVRVLEHGLASDGFAYIAMDYLPGCDLEALVRLHGRLDVARAVHLMRQACRGLADAHRAGVVHRDVKPSNLHCANRPGEEDTLRILDFGVARRLGSTPVTLDGVVIGTPAFLAPEAFAGAGLTPASDVYALGCTFYFAITAAMPFDDADPDTLREAHRVAPVVPPSLRGDRIDVPRAVERVILRALAKRPSDRYPDAAAMAAALDAASEELAPWTSEDATRWWQRARTGRIPTPLPSQERTTEVGLPR